MQIIEPVKDFIWEVHKSSAKQRRCLYKFGLKKTLVEELTLEQASRLLGVLVDISKENGDSEKSVKEKEGVPTMVNVRERSDCQFDIL